MAGATIPASNSDSHDIFETDVLTAERFYRSRRIQRSPEIELMAAVLEDVCECLREDSQEAEEALAWIDAQGEENWLFSFHNVCEFLDLDPVYLRQGLHRWHDARTQSLSVG